MISIRYDIVCKLSRLSFDLVSGVTLAAYAIPVSLAYATLAGLPPQVGLYAYMVGGPAYALAGSSRYLAIGPTSAISLMIAGTAAEMAAVLAANPFPDTPRNCTVAIFLDHPPPADALHYATGQRDEKVQLGLREIYVHYGEGMADSRLKIPAAKDGTARNMNTIAKLAEMSAALQIHL